MCRFTFTDLQIPPFSFQIIPFFLLFHKSTDFKATHSHHTHCPSYIHHYHTPFISTSSQSIDRTHFLNTSITRECPSTSSFHSTNITCISTNHRIIHSSRKQSFSTIPLLINSSIYTILSNQHMSPKTLSSTILTSKYTLLSHLFMDAKRLHAIAISIPSL